MTLTSQTIAGEEPSASPFPWWTSLLLGVFSVIFGIVVLAWPGLSLRVMAALVGIWLLLAGLFRIVGAFLPVGRGLARSVLSGLVGMILVVAGVICLRNIVTALGVLAAIVALTWLLGGIATFVMGLQETGGARALLLVVGGLSVIAGLVFVFTPSLSLGVMIVLTGISGIVVGLFEIALGFRLRRVTA
ncbi:HdeD family acid-resistance protein [Paractinoplanes hotanensis]|uniref:DUF308 domain-containing protein n=1 Tax=Paractinoplanes hotanensis TaxID=2906497 RepID=A0ABT0Y2S6_9ACTN|nr:DUF308 domain-containing protein [Actinoplanes hotanensis]MCM4080306.1 DUF308 domain-containing protein [Actinoplanes hotanensis]